MSIYNLTLVGETGSKVLINPRYAWVMSFQNSKNIKIDNVIIGHSVGGYCQGGVLSFVNSEDIEINNSVLFGCGTTGLQIDKVDHLRFLNSTIKDCTYNLLGIFNSTNICFEKSTFENTGKFNLIYISDFTYNVKFSNCIIRNNWNVNYEPYLIEIGEETANISLIGSKIIDNKTKKFINQIDRLTMADNTFLYNSFSDFLVEYKN
ncbi:MAG TPA: right-handed parallel beta-helix repeat-containing protein [Sedimentisphaerales bacterium]|nr:right-handed parallel beta-helix repeat-containing protein [Sedimentisphaerales bacterium]